MINGTFIVNKFLQSAPTNVTYEMLINSAKRHNINMEIRTNADYMVRLDNGIVTPTFTPNDFVLFWNKDVALGKALENQGLRLFNPSEAIRLCDNKAYTTEALAGIVNMPKTFKVPMTFDGIGYNNSDFIDMISDIIGYPFVVKECWGSYGGQVYLATDKERAVEIFASVDGTECIVQEYISTNSGRDLRAYVVGDRVVAAIERRNSHDFRANIANGGESFPYAITKEQEEMAVLAAKSLGLDFAGVDLLFLENDAPILCEVNSNAQFKGLYQATGIDITDAIFEHITDHCNSRI